MTFIVHAAFYISGLVVHKHTLLSIVCLTELSFVSLWRKYTHALSVQCIVAERVETIEITLMELSKHNSNHSGFVLMAHSLKNNYVQIKQ